MSRLASVVTDLEDNSDVFLFLPGLGAGGVERVVTTVSNFWASSGETICILLLSNSKNIFYSVDARIKIVTLDNGTYPTSSILLFLKYFRVCIALRRLLVSSAPRVLISFLPVPNIISILASYKLSTTIIVSERNDIKLRKISLHWRILRQLTYKHADIVTTNLAKNCASLVRFVKSDKLQFLPNPVHISTKQIALQSRTKTILCVGRLTKQKGYDLLIPAYANSNCISKGWKLVIVGHGEDFRVLEGQIQELGLSSVVSIHRPTPHLWEEFGNSSIFAMPSRYEGLPNALLEAIAHGLIPFVSNRVGDLSDSIKSVESHLVYDVDNSKDISEQLEWVTSHYQDFYTVDQPFLKLLTPFKFENAIKHWNRLIE